jgi:glucose/mannose transport system substrate-binding protein
MSSGCTPAALSQEHRLGLRDLVKVGMAEVLGSTHEAYGSYCLHQVARMTLRSLLVCASALMFAACTVNSADSDDDILLPPNSAGAGATAGAGVGVGGSSSPASGASSSGGAGGLAEALPSGPLEIFSWLTSGAEGTGFDAMTREFLARYPKIELINTVQLLPDKARDLLKSRLSSEDPPDLFQDSPGTGLARWVTDSGDIRKSRVAPLGSLSKAAGWDKAFPPALLESLSYQGDLYAVPLTVTRSNVLFYSPALLGSGKAPYTLVELKSLSNELQQSGKQPLVFGFKTGFTATLFVFDVMLPAVAGARFREDYLHGKLTADDPKLVEALKETAELLKLANVDRAELSWIDAAKRVADGTAAMTVLGDWARTSFALWGKAPGVAFDAAPAPGTAGMFVFSANVFAKPAAAKNQAAADALLAFMATEAGQVAYASKSGSIPARLGVDESGFDPLIARVIQDYRKDTLTLSIEHLLDAGLLTELHSVTQQFGIDGNFEPLLAFLKQNYKAFR